MLAFFIVGDPESHQQVAPAFPDRQQRAKPPVAYAPPLLALSLEEKDGALAAVMYLSGL